MPKKIDQDKLFKIVVRSIIKEGYAKTTTKQIAQSAGINEVTLYRKYGSKIDLIQQAFQAILSHSPLNNLKYTGDIEADLLAIIKAYRESSALYGEIIPTIILEAPRDPKLKILLAPFYLIYQNISGIIKKYQEQGLIKTDTGIPASRILLGPIIVNNMLMQANPEMHHPPIDDQEYLAAYLRGVQSN